MNERMNLRAEAVKRRRRRKRKRLIRRVSTGFLVAAAAVYLSIGLNYRDKFLPNTMVGGISVSGLTITEATSRITEDVRQYQLVLEERGGREERISGQEMDLHPVFDGTMERILQEQNPLLWGLRLINGTAFPSGYQVEYLSLIHI